MSSPRDAIEVLNIPAFPRFGISAREYSAKDYSLLNMPHKTRLTMAFSKHKWLKILADSGEHYS
ncbi:MAG: hypothetical protein WCL29_03580, partial [Pseudomonadota bacterium]